MAEPEQVARGLLDALQDALVAHDLAAKVSSLLDDKVVIFGTAAENLDGEQSISYVARVLGFRTHRERLTGTDSPFD